MIGLGIGIAAQQRRGDTRDPDALAYIAAVETADGEPLEAGVKTAINDFVVGCKSDGIWDAIKASCILAGARTLNGALVPLVGPAPDNFNFVPEDYNRVTGLKGDGSTKYLNSNYFTDQDADNSVHMGAFVSDQPTFTGASILGGQAANFNNRFRWDANSSEIRLRNITTRAISVNHGSNSFLGATRSGQTLTAVFGANTNSRSDSVIDSPGSSNVAVFAQINENSALSISDARLSFYTLGANIDLFALRDRVSALMGTIEDALT